MKIRTLKEVYFSPTKTTQQIVDSICKGIDADFTMSIDITSPMEEITKIECSTNEILVIGVPVYSGRVPQTAVDRLRSLKGENTPAVLVAVYGNAKVDDALIELFDIVEIAGFIPIAAATFIGEHSFSTDEQPIAINRPDTDDLLAAVDFGRQIQEKTAALCSDKNITPISVPGNRPYKVATPLSLGVPDVDSDLCTDCKVCSTVCPTGAIDRENNNSNDEECISCYACIKSCSEGARFQNDPVMTAVKDKLHSNFKTRKEPEFIL